MWQKRYVKAIPLAAEIKEVLTSSSLEAETGSDQ
jgi:hypothetical protein